MSMQPTCPMDIYCYDLCGSSSFPDCPLASWFFLYYATRYCIQKSSFLSDNHGFFCPISMLVDLHLRLPFIKGLLDGGVLGGQILPYNHTPITMIDRMTCHPPLLFSALNSVLFLAFRLVAIVLCKKTSLSIKLQFLKIICQCYFSPQRIV